MSEQARKAWNEAMRRWADGLYYNKGIFDEAVVYFDGEGVYFPSGDKDSSTVRFSYVTMETLKQALAAE